MLFVTRYIFTFICHVTHVMYYNCRLVNSIILSMALKRIKYNWHFTNNKIICVFHLCSFTCFHLQKFFQLKQNKSDFIKIMIPTTSIFIALLLITSQENLLFSLLYLCNDWGRERKSLVSNVTTTLVRTDSFYIIST